MTRPRPSRAQAQQAALSAALSGAVDLSGLKARADAQAQAERSGQPAPTADGPQASAAPDAGPAPSSGSGSPYVVDVTEEGFQALLERSMQVPVVLEFWSSQAPADQQYGDTFINLAAQGEGSWLLGRVEVSQAMRIAQAMGLRGIPAVRAVFQGQMVAEFDGQQPEDRIREFIRAIVEGTGGTLPEGAGPVEDPRVEEAENLLAAGELDAARATYESLLADQPGHALAADAIRQIDLMQRVGDEADLDADIAAADADPGNVELALRAADLQVASGDYEGAFGRLLGFIRGSDPDAKETARARLVELFAIVGNAEPAVAQARRDLASALF